MQIRVLLPLFLSVAGQLGQFSTASETGKSPNPIPIVRSVSIPASVGAVTELVFRSPLGFSEINVNFTCASGRPIEGVFANLELLNENGRRIMTFPANITTKFGESHEQWPIRLSGLQEYTVPTIKLGTKVSLLGYNPRSVANYPVGAILSYFKVFYTDGTSFEAVLPDWYSDSVPYKASGTPGGDLRKTVFRSWVKAVIPADGRIAIESAKELTTKQRSYLRKIVDSWIVLPAIHSGVATQSDVLLFISHGACKSVATLPHNAPEGPWINVNICPRKDSSSDEVYVGGFIQ